MALPQSAVSDLLEVLRTGEAIDLIRESVRIGSPIRRRHSWGAGLGGRSTSSTPCGIPSAVDEM
jgi:hypothetical protein